MKFEHEVTRREGGSAREKARERVGERKREREKERERGGWRVREGERKKERHKDRLCLLILYLKRWCRRARGEGGNVLRVILQ